MIELNNNKLNIVISPKGAELQSIYSNEHQFEYMWNADPAYWSKRSPVLFPIVGQLKNDTYFYDGKEYHLPRHGFARDSEFQVAHSDETSATFVLKSNNETLAIYPFHFILSITYRLNESSLSITYSVENTTDEDMYFSIGGHPAFAVPLTKGAAFTDYYLQFDQPVIAPRYILDNGLISGHTAPVSQNPLPLTHDLFNKDALIFKNVPAKTISLKSSVSPHGITVRYADFPYLGIWSAKDAPFICIEPWHGIADSTTHNMELTQKEGIIKLSGNGKWCATWEVSLW